MTDPDADRLGVYAKDEKDRRICKLYGKYVRLAGCGVYLKGKERKRRTPENAAIVETIVTTDMLKAVAERNTV